MLTNDDIPVLLIGYNRPEFLRDRINELKLMPIKHLYLSIDGGLGSNSTEIEEIKIYAKKVFQDLITFKIYHQSKNLGLVRHIHQAIAQTLRQFKYVIIVEDDISMSSNFYQNMINGFNLQAKLQIQGIVGSFSPLNLRKLEFIPNKWRTSKYCTIWGWGCSREVWDKYEYDLAGIDFELSLSKSQIWRRLNKFQREVWNGRFVKIQADPFNTWDIQLQYWSFKYNFTNIYPIFSLVKNVGFNDDRATHTKEHKPKWMSKANGHNNLIVKKKIFNFLNFPINILESNSTAGDSKFHHWWRN